MMLSDATDEYLANRRRLSCQGLLRVALGAGLRPRPTSHEEFLNHADERYLRLSHERLILEDTRSPASHS